MANSPSDFAKRMLKRAEEFEQARKDIMRETVLAVSSAVIQATPVDTGRARSNWHMSIDYADPTTFGGVPDKSGNVSLEQIKSGIRLYKPGQTVIVQNNLEYIQRLNDGWSAQAPAGFVEEAVEAATGAAKDVKIFK